jgi:hypothetical protein
VQSEIGERRLEVIAIPGPFRLELLFETASAGPVSRRAVADRPVGLGTVDKRHSQSYVLVLGGHAVGRYALWLAFLLEEPHAKPGTEVLVIARRGDSGHPVRAAEEWAEALDVLS